MTELLMAQRGASPCGLVAYAPVVLYCTIVNLFAAVVHVFRALWLTATAWMTCVVRKIGSPGVHLAHQDMLQVNGNGIRAHFALFTCLG